MSIGNPRTNRLTLTDIDLSNIRKVREPGRYKNIAVEIAANVERQGWISQKQRDTLNRVANRVPMYSGRYSGRSRSTFPVDYTESDWELNAYDLCVEGW